MLSKFVLPGNKVEIRPIVQADEEEQDLNQQKQVYQSQVYDIQSDERLEIYMPMVKNRLISLPVNTEYDLFFMTGGGIFECTAVVLDVYKIEKAFVLLLETTSTLRKNQRREFFRLECALEMYSRPLEKDEIRAVLRHDNYLKANLPLDPGIIVDISGGGLRFVGESAYGVDDLIYCKYTLIKEEKPKDYTMVAKILMSRELENKPGSYEHRAQYINIDNSEREEIIRFIFKEESKRRKREKGL